MPSSYNGAVKTKTEGLDLEQVILKYKPVITFRVKKALGSHGPDWEDVVQEILSQAVQKIQSGEFRGDSSVGTFLYTITSRRIIDFIRHKTKVLKEAPEPGPLADPYKDAMERERSEMLASALAKLKPKYREVLYLYYYQELSRDEVAARLGISTRKVSERVNYAQKLMKKLVRK